MGTKTIQRQAPSLQVNTSTHSIYGANGPVGLTPREYDLLTCLVDHTGCPLTRTELLSDAWGWDFASELKTKTVDMHVRRLRMKFERAGLDPKAISTVRGRGYVYIA